MSAIGRWFSRAPIGLYRVGLGRMLGHRFLLLVHRGRTSGLDRQAVLEVVGTEGGDPLIVSGFGPTSQWYRNLRACPEARVVWAAERFPVRADFYDNEAGATVLASYAVRYPRAARVLGSRLGLPFDDPAAMADAVPVIRLRRQPATS